MGRLEPIRRKKDSKIETIFEEEYVIKKNKECNCIYIFFLLYLLITFGIFVYYNFITINIF